LAERIKKEVHPTLVRLEEVAKSNGKSLSVLAKELGYSQPFFYSYKSQGNALGAAVYKDLHKVGINPEYIKTGQGEPLLDKPTKVQETQRGYLSNIKVVKSRPVKVLMQRVPADGRHTYAPDTVRDAIKQFQMVFPDWKPRQDQTIKPPNKEDLGGINCESDYLYDIF
jgi:hypothetical protein